MIVPDGKDWTWVLERPCPECGFDASGFAREQVATEARSNAASWVKLLDQPGCGLRTRVDRWSVLEYACHVRDVFRVCDYRLERMLREDGPHYENWDQDVTAIDERYDEQDPATVGEEVVAAAGLIAERFDTVSGNAWQGTGCRSDGARFTVDSFSRYVIHDPMHHLWDVGAQT